MCQHILWRMPVHPHACGENSALPCLFCSLVGSPPRVWGKHSHQAAASWLLRFTPTRVGKTTSGRPVVGDVSVHPHACGENFHSHIPSWRVTGSPPRVWGKRFSGLKNGLAESVHPHACGENGGVAPVRDYDDGSPPRVWGKLQGDKDLTGVERFTPTRVGKTGSSMVGMSVRPVHPHACGENVSHVVSQQLRRGSPPRVWGKPDLGRGLFCADRFTPTRVGKTFLSYFFPVFLLVHPHACGENGVARFRFAFGSGSPPRVWGKRRLQYCKPTQMRFTPTRVGKTLALDDNLAAFRFTPTRVGKTGRPDASSLSCPVHPHACGENATTCAPSMPTTRFTPTRVGKTCHGLVLGLLQGGSPPRVWGKPRLGAGARAWCPVHPHACGENGRRRSVS